MSILIRNLQKHVLINTKWVERIVKEVGKVTDTEDYDVCMWLVDNETTHQMNLEERNKDKPADVLSVPLHPDNPPGKRPPDFADEYDLGDIYLSLEMLEQQAKEREIDFDLHLKKTIIHGYCHLLGYDHETDSDFKLMLNEENRIFNTLHHLNKE